MEPGTDWTGWHRIEKSLWVSNGTAGMAPYADQLMANVTELSRRVQTLELTPDQLQRRQGAARRGGHGQDHRPGAAVLPY